MARRKMKARRRRRKTFSLLKAAESYAYLEILMRGTTGTGPVGFFTGDYDLKSVSNYTLGTEVSKISGAEQISLRDLLNEPGLSLQQIGSNLMNTQTVANMAIASLLTNVSFRVGTRLLRRPINNVNSNIVRPLLGAGVKL
tara:strand:- start:111 stop:533 length:423 start_codon:yes stop_codon:yes gene_type:complete